ncbi:hypothetical protein TNCV_1998011 [Trichonephila clavipes]|uniref:PiggyBac transposable element-derived protein domain-containing protein n=1 Tax=Trichonephila clavipes TaxID=2585209 RepID=A0A8X6RQT6_TRICX|nr:hypothetical protein TNCV_1998011 [Trichonephila clavipes]
MIGEENEVNTGEKIVTDVPRSLEADSTTSDLLKQMKTALKDKTPSKLFVQFCSSEDYDLIVKGTTPYVADGINEQDFLITADDILVFIGILLLIGYHSNTCERDCWSDADTLALPW